LSGARIHRFKVPAFEREQFDIVTGGACRFRETLRNADGHDVVRLAMEQAQACMQRQTPHGVGFRDIAAVDKLFDHGIAELQLERPLQIGDRSQADHSSQFRVTIRREPQCEMSARGVSHSDRARQIQVMRVGNGAQVTSASEHVLTGARPSAACIANGPELQIPGSDSPLAQRLAKMPHVGEVELVPPKAAVDHNGDGVMGTAGRQPQFTELPGLGTVG